MRKLFRELANAVLWLTGTGAAANARSEVDGAAASVADIDAQLERVPHPTQPRAA